MSMKIKGGILDPTTPYGLAAREDVRAKHKYQTLNQDYLGLQKEVDNMKSRLEAGKQSKMALAAEVRFLRKRFSYLVKMKTKNSPPKEKLGQSPNLQKQTKQTERLRRKEATLPILPLIPQVRPKKKQYVSKKVGLFGTSPVGNPDFSHKVRLDAGKVNLMQIAAPFLDLHTKGRMYANDTALSNAATAFDLNQVSSSSVRELSLPSRAPIFDLNEISMGDEDEDFQTNDEEVKYEESRRSLMRHPNDEVQNDLMLSICRNAGEGSSRVGKRKISWQDPVALRV
ncbi:hypothetical protein SASPL_128568 [Salvia splendens]|uniref:Uncharacterized protein n=1 Tax=Salvia splendens TaxID=180675 RepID=A0A8X8ZM73_SALSN|nr:uncharacterized protein LOC121753123 [Salvia splendens]KAG6410507.1 hypothetical protein SASPL_128568 [Salvia splendens]